MISLLEASGSSFITQFFCKFIVMFITPHAQRERGKVIGLGVLIYIYMFVVKKNLNRTLAIDLPFQTFAVGLLVEFIDWF